MSQLCGIKGIIYSSVFFSKDLLKQFMLLCSLGEVLPIFNFCDYFYLTGTWASVFKKNKIFTKSTLDLKKHLTTRFQFECPKYQQK